MAKKICLVDGSGYIFRAFYGLPPLTSPEGAPVNAVYGFTNMFLRLTQKIECDFNLVLFDAKRENFRNEIFADYKATRKDVPEDLIPQFPIIREAVTALNLNYLEMEGFEADDLIATYARLAREKNMEVVIVSADKDLMQLIRDGVTFYDPMKDKFFSPEDVKEKFGVYPEQVVDVQALSGDSTDNIPGVPGIGPKTAADLVNTYGSLAEVLAHAGEIKQNKRRETLLANIENANISLQLVTLKDDVPVERLPEDYPCRCPDRAVIDNFVNKYGFTSIKNRMANWLEKQCAKEYDDLKPRAELKKEYEIISDEIGLKHWAELIKTQGSFAFKAFNNGPNPVFDQILGLVLAVDNQKAAYIPLSKTAGSGATMDLFSASDKSSLSRELAAKYLKPLFEASSILKIGHNLKTDMHFVSQLLGSDVKIFPYDDIEVISYVLDSSEHPHNLPALAELFLDYKMQSVEEVFGSGKNKTLPKDIDLDKVSTYMAEQADIIYRLHRLLRPRLLSEHMVTIYEHYDRPLIATLYEMEKNGIKVNAQELGNLSLYLETELAKIEKEIFAQTGVEFNVASPKQVGEVLYNKLGLKGKKNAKGALQTGADVLEQMAEENPVAQKILDWRLIAKLKSTYTDSLLGLLDKSNRVHTTYSQVTANTGRLSSTNPNLQNIPIRSEEGLKIRRCFVAKPGYKLISADYSQVELRLMAVIADVKGLKEAFDHNIDIHTATAMKVFGLDKEEVTPNIRRHAKAINFGIIYGQTPYGLAKTIDVSVEDAKKYIDAYFVKMPEIKDYMEKTINFGRKYGYVVTPFGRKVSVLGINDKNKRIASFAERAAINAPLQGGAADIMKRAMNEVFYRLTNEGFQTKVLLQVHDELVLEAPEAEVEAAAKLLKETMENAVKYDVKFEADVGVGDNWSAAH